MTNEECRLVQASFAQVDMAAERIAAAFYRRLFDLDPSLAPLFKTDMELQAVKFMEKLAIAVKGLDDLASITEFAHALGRRHAAYSVKSEHYVTAGEALLWALEKELGPSFTPHVKSAWATAYRALSNVMLEAVKVP